MDQEIKIGVITWQVIEVKDLIKNDYIKGDSNIHNNTIRIDAELTDIEKQQILFHELLHVCLNVMREDELNENEKFINILSHLLVQIHNQLTINTKLKRYDYSEDI